jgi:putative two-component system response regulator
MTLPSSENGKARILVVDDAAANRMLLTDFITAMGHEVVTADNGKEALDLLEKHPVDLVLLDIMMPVLDGYATLDRIKDNLRTIHLPVIVISGLDEIPSTVRCIERGAEDYLTKPFNPVLLRARIDACIERKRLHDRDAFYRTELEERVREQVRAISETQQATIFAMSSLAESRDPETGEHLERMRAYVRVLAMRLAESPRHASVIDARFIEDLFAAAPLHDIGKVGVPDMILMKPGKLTAAEFDIMKQHTIIGAKTLRAVDRQHPGNAFVMLGIEIAESHHEKWDGSGYPNGLAGEDIPLSGRIMAVADVYDALTTKRCYKEAFSHEKSRAIIAEGRGTHFDPDLVDAFMQEENAILEIRERYQDTEKELLLWAAERA